MRVFRSFILRLSCCLSATLIICLLLMAGTFKLQYLDEKAIYCLVLAIAVSPITLILFRRIKKKDPELSSMVAAYLHPAEGLTSLALCYLMGAILISQLPEPGNQHLMFVMAGLAIFIFRIYLIIEIKFLRRESDLAYEDQ